MGGTISSKCVASSRLCSQLDREHIPLIGLTMDGEWNSEGLYEKSRGGYCCYGELSP